MGEMARPVLSSTSTTDMDVSTRTPEIGCREESGQLPCDVHTTTLFFSCAFQEPQASRVSGVVAMGISPEHDETHDGGHMSNPSLGRLGRVSLGLKVDLSFSGGPAGRGAEAEQSTASPDREVTCFVAGCHGLLGLAPERRACGKNSVCRAA